jgi:hypothetical protein
MRRITQLLVLVGVFAVAATGGTARAGGGLLGGLVGGNCGSTQQVFAHWQDYAGYYFASNGGFESGTTGWNVSGPAALAGTNDPYDLSGPGDTSLTLGRGGTASISVCYGLTYPAVRFVAAGVGGPATIHVRVVAHSLLGLLSTLDGGTFTVPAGWDAAPKLSTLFSALAAPLGTKSMELRITVESGTAQIDDLFVDPWLTKA